MVVYQPKRIKFGIIARSRAYGQFGCLVSTRQNCQTSFLNSHRKRKSLLNKGCLTRKNEFQVIISRSLSNVLIANLLPIKKGIRLMPHKLCHIIYAAQGIA